MKLLLPYLILINFFGFFLMLLDKQKARRNAWRIPERALILAALIGGSVGVYAGMQLFRHKTRHPKFYIGIPVILLLHFLLAGALLWYFPTA